MKAFFNRRCKRLQEFVFRFQNYRYWRIKGMSMSSAWKKSDLTL